MALKIDTILLDDFTSQAYFRISDVTTFKDFNCENPNQLRITVEISEEKGFTWLEMNEYICDYDPESFDNLFMQAYAYLKSLPEYAEAINV